MVRISWGKHRSVAIELFAIGNLAFLALDIFLAHSINRFHHSAEWIPFWFSVASPPILAGLLTARKRLAILDQIGGLVVGFGAIAVGVAGLVFHLKSQFFESLTISSLVYTAPFAAPLAYAGIGFLLVLNRMVASKTIEWSQWIVFFALGGFAGNFALALCDHAQNGFFNREEWIPVFASAVAVGFLVPALISRPNPPFLRLCLVVLAIQVAVGATGFVLHLYANVGGPSDNFTDNFLYGAPVFAPLLFPNLAILAAIGVVDLRAKLVAEPV